MVARAAHGHGAVSPRSRVGLTKAATSLQQRKLIRYRRGAITILVHRGLKAASCGCYDADKISYARMMG